jgi:hypothetical protein
MKLITLNGQMITSITWQSDMN